MPKSEFKITVPHTVYQTYTIKAENWQQAVAKAEARADAQGLETAGSFQVADSDWNPVDTFA